MQPGRKRFLCRLSLALCLCFPSVTWAQNAHGTLRGVVEDPTHARIPGAQIVVHAVDSSVERDVQSDSHGEFRVEDLLPGQYRLTVNASGFAQAGSDVSVPVSLVIDVTVQLKPAAVQQAIQVQAEASSIT